VYNRKNEASTKQNSLLIRRLFEVPERLAAQEEKNRCAEGEDSRQDAKQSASKRDPKRGQAGEQEEQDHAPGGNCGWHFHFCFSFGKFDFGLL
jgi:hypothetical protein